MSKESKTEALEKAKKGKKCHCGKEKGHEGKHKIDKVEYEKKGKVRDEQETEAEEEEDNQ
jgi:hypothetical protein